MKKQNTTPTDHIAGVILNTGETCRLSKKAYKKHVLDRFTRMVEAGGGGFVRPAGIIALDVMQGHISTTFEVGFNSKGVGVGILVASTLWDQAIWDLHLQTHDRMLASFNLPPLDREIAKPAALPWVSISLHPSFLMSAPPDEAAAVVGTFMGASFGVIENQRKNGFGQSI